jgi:microcystin-dependent protein
MLCDGRGLDTTTYALLFNVIGYAYGGSGTTFNLPNPAGRVIGAVGTGAGLTQRAINDAVGVETVTLTRNEMPAHTHGPTNVSGNTNGTGVTGSESAHTHTYQDAYFAENAGGGGSIFGNGSTTDTDNVFRWRTAAGGSSTTASDINTGAGTAHNHAIGETGGGQPHNNMQPTLFVGNMFIYSGRNMDAYFPYTWVGGTPGNVAIY